MIPDSKFIQSIFRQDFPPELRFHLLFSHRGNGSLFLVNNDGKVELSSLLDYRAQNEAVEIYGFDEDHSSILISPKFLEHYHGILNRDKVR